MNPDSLYSLLAVAIGFAVAGLVSSGYQLFARRPASFRLLDEGPRPSAIAAVPLLVFAAPFIIMRQTVRGSALQDGRFEFAMIATVVAGVWSLMSGTVVVMMVEAISGYLA